MQLLTLVLNKVEVLEELLAELARSGIKGATILDSTGMATALLNSDEELPFFGALGKVLNPDREESKTILMVLRDEQIETAKQVIQAVTGGIEKPNTGILFGVPINFVEGTVEE